MSAPAHKFLKASAGTGKTYQLVQAYVEHIVDRKLSPTQVVAITFTKKAAAELRSRIRQRLIERGVSRDTLNELARAPIANFHGLALQMLSAFGIHAGFTDVPVIMGELGEDERMFRIACEEAWFGSRKESRDALTAASEFIRLSARGANGEGLIDVMWGAVAKAREEDDPRPIWDRFVTHDPRAAQADVHARWLAFRADLLARRMTFTGQTKLRVGNFLEMQVPPLGDDLASWASAWGKAADELFNTRLGESMVPQLGPGVLKFSKVKESLILMLDEPLGEQTCAQLVPHLQELMRSSIERYAALKRETRSADFPDLIEQTSHALTHDTELHQRVRDQYKVVLVDEAQDTNASQRRFVRLIAGLEGAVQGGEPATLFVVGDRKQAIYTFRGADPEAFNHFGDELMQLGAEVSDLTVSRRSSPGVVAGVNHLGHAMMKPYEALEALPGKSGVPGAALTWLTANADPDATAGQRADAEARAVARLIRGAIDRGAEPSSFAILLRAMSKAQKFTRALAALGIPSVTSGGSGFYDQPEIVDLMSLLTWLVDGDALLDAAVALRSPLFGFSDSAMLRMFGDRAVLKALRRGDASTFTSSYDPDVVTARLVAPLLPRLVDAVATLGAGRAVARILDALEVRAALLALPFGEQKVANIERFAELAWAHERGSGRGSPHFVFEQRDLARRRVIEPLRAIGAARDRAVSIMTVHQAKGLEFDHVILADMSQERADRGPSLWHARGFGFIVSAERRGATGKQSKMLRSRAYREASEKLKDEDADERRRLLYVAVTRARRELTFVTTDGAYQMGFNRILSKPDDEQPVGWKDRALNDGVMVARREDELAPVVRESVVAAEVVAPAVLPTIAPASRDTKVAAGQLSLFAVADTKVAANPSLASVPYADYRIGAAPAGSRFALTVTDLENALSENAGWQRHAVGKSANADDVAVDATLDPLTRGRISHMVLANLHRVGAHKTREEFINAELQLCGYDPEDPRLEDVRNDLQSFLTSPLGLKVAALPPEQRRHEMPFVLPFEVDGYTATISGQIDLLYWDDDAPVIVDFKHAHAKNTAEDAYATQLDAYAMAVARLCDVDGPISTSLVFLRDRAQTRNRMVTHAMRERLHGDVARVVRELAAASQR